MAESSPTIQDLFNTREVSLLDALLDGAISKPDGKQGELEHPSRQSSCVLNAWSLKQYAKWKVALML